MGSLRTEDEQDCCSPRVSWSASSEWESLGRKLVAIQVRLLELLGPAVALVQARK
jgi:hypothetical protein